VNDEQSEPQSNASDSADTSLQEEHDDFGNLFDVFDYSFVIQWKL